MEASKGSNFSTFSRCIMILLLYIDCQGGRTTAIARHVSFAQITCFSPEPNTSLRCSVTTDTGLVHRTVCLFTSQLSLVLVAPTHGGMARLS